MKEAFLNTNKIAFKDSDGNTLLEAFILELYYLLAYGGVSDEKLSHIQKMDKAAGLLNQKYGCALEWYQAASILESITEELEDAKKNFTSTPE